MHKIFEKFFIITGGPGSGKTSIVNELKILGYNTVPEGARAIIKEQINKNGDALPWKDNLKFRKLSLEYAIKSYKQALKKNKLTFFDCDLLELIAYNKFDNLENSKELLEAANSLKYNKQVFITPPWEEIFHKDQERRQTFQQAIQIYNEVTKTYKQYNYELIEIPKLTINQRANFVISKIK